MNEQKSKCCGAQTLVHDNSTYCLECHKFLYGGRPLEKDFKAMDPPKKRKPVQIAAYSGNEYIHTNGVFALCDDGSMWVMMFYENTENEWLQLPDIPQEFPNDSE